LINTDGPARAVSCADPGACPVACGSLALFLALCFSAGPASAHSGSADLTGEVRDLSGAALPHASLALTCLDSGEAVATESSDAGV
jgi:hypothetical protein